MAIDETTSPWRAGPRKRATHFPEKKEAVIAAAAGLIRRNGYEGTSLADLADILNITKPTLYYYVGSKDELFFEIISRAQEQTLKLIEEAAASDATGVEKLRRIMIGFANTMMSDFGACLSLPWPESVEASYRLKHASKVRAANELITGVVLEGHHDGTIRRIDPVFVLNVLFGSLNWLPRWYKPNGRLSPQKFAETQVDILLNGVVARADEPAKTSARGRSARKKAAY